MIEKKTTIYGKEVTLRSSGLIPKLYRAQFGRDMFVDMKKFVNAYKETQGDEEKMLNDFDLGVLERAAWIMLKYGGEDVGESPDEWLDNLDGVFSVYEALPVVLDMWNKNNATTSVPAKKQGQQSASQTGQFSC